MVRNPEDTAPELPGTHSRLRKRQVQNWERHRENPRLIHASLVDLPHVRDKPPPESGPTKKAEREAFAQKRYEDIILLPQNHTKWKGRREMILSKWGPLTFSS